jgi:ElaA protein
MSSTITIKDWAELSQDELYDLIRLRLAVFVVEQNCPYQDADNKDRASVHVLMHDDRGLLIGCARLVKPGISYKEWSIGRVAVALTHRNQGLGKELLLHCLAHLKNQTQESPVRISAQYYLLQFYTALGFQQVSDIYLEDNIPHVEMLLSDYSIIPS